jgi:hypothetical protein
LKRVEKNRRRRRKIGESNTSTPEGNVDLQSGPEEKAFLSVPSSLSLVVFFFPKKKLKGKRHHKVEIVYWTTPTKKISNNFFLSNG